MADDPKGPPQSPDQLGGGLRGRVSGVTRIGGRAFAIGVGVLALLAFLIFYGVTKKNAPPGPPPVAVVSISPDSTATEDAGFAGNVPVVPTSTPTSDVVILPSAVPEVTTAPAAPVAAPATLSPAEAQAEADAEAERQREEAAREAAEKAREEALEAAKRSHILTGQGVAQAGGANVDSASGVQQLSYAGNGSADTQGGGGNAAPNLGGGDAYPSAGGAGAGGAGAAGGASSQRYTVSNALLGRPSPDTSAQQSSAQVSNTAFLSGPTNQYNHVQGASNIYLPQGANPEDILQSQRFAPVSPFEITAGSVLPSELITDVDSELPGLLSAMIREDVYDTKTGKYLLIPRGSKLVGLYKTTNGYGSSRVLVAWTRLIFPDTTSIDLLNMSGADVQGGAGFGGDVDNHYGKVFGAALLTSILAAGASLATPSQASTSGTISPTTLAASQISQNILNIGSDITNKALNIPPTVHVAKGYPFLVVVDKDIVLPGPYGRGL